MFTKRKIIYVLVKMDVDVCEDVDGPELVDHFKENLIIRPEYPLGCISHFKPELIAVDINHLE